MALVDSRYPITGRLISLGGSSAQTSILQYLQTTEDTTDAVLIHFPAMPDSISLERTADYRVNPTAATPDGIHQYRYTQPLEIPFSFTLHAGDEYCSEGSKTILDIAAKLQSLVLPINNSPDKNSISAVFVGDTVQPQNTKSSTQKSNVPGSAEQSSQTGTPAHIQSVAQATQIQLTNNPANYAMSNPVTVLLDLISLVSGGTDALGGVGLRCVGYIKSVNVKLNGPWLSNLDATVKNLPTSAEYSFTFVHNPAQTNELTKTTTGFQTKAFNAFASDVRKSLYNTVGLLRSSNIAYRGLDYRGGSIKSDGVKTTGVPEPSSTRLTDSIDVQARTIGVQSSLQ